MSFKRSPISLSLLLATHLAVSGCATSGGFHLPADDLKAAIERKPIPTDDIVTSQKAADDFSASLEAWGDRVSAAGGRLCRYTARTTGKLPFACPTR